MPPSSPVPPSPPRAGARAAGRRPRAARTRPNTALTRIGFLLLAAGLDAAAILGIAVGERRAARPRRGAVNDARARRRVAALFVVPGALRHDYAITRYLTHKGHAKRP